MCELTPQRHVPASLSQCHCTPAPDPKNWDLLAVRAVCVCVCVHITCEYVCVFELTQGQDIIMTNITTSIFPPTTPPTTYLSSGPSAGTVILQNFRFVTCNSLCSICWSRSGRPSSWRADMGRASSVVSGSVFLQWREEA